MFTNIFCSHSQVTFKLLLWTTGSCFLYSLYTYKHMSYLPEWEKSKIYKTNIQDCGLTTYFRISTVIKLNATVNSAALVQITIY